MHQAAHDLTLAAATDFSGMPGWEADDHAAALRTLRAGASVAKTASTRALGVEGAQLFTLLRLACSIPEPIGRDEARAFFERHFSPRRVAAPGFVTGYYEPEVAASLTHTAEFGTPLYRRPHDLLEIGEADRPAGWASDVRFARRTDAGIVPFFDRAAIERGALEGQGLELAWLADPVDAFFIHVQGSARLRLVGGGTLRIGFDGKSGHPYTSIGRLAVERGLVSREDAHKEGLEAWLKAHPQKGRALMRENRSFIFFRATEQGEGEGPLGAAGVALVPGRSLAVDRLLHTFHTPIWVDAPGVQEETGASGPFRRLMIAQDTGSAIVGPARGDIFFGSGGRAGSLAGRIRHAAAMTILAPKE